MRINIYNRCLHISWLPLLLVCFLSVVMMKLGFWQLSRAAEKKAFLSSVANAQTQKTQTLYTVPQDFIEWQYRKIEISGRYLDSKQLLLDNQFSGKTDDKRAGYDVITPFVLKDGSAILVNRGWLPRKSSKADLPVVDIDDDIKSVTGVIRLPSRSFSLGQMTEQTSAWPRLIQFIDINSIEKLLELELQDVIIMLLPDESAGYERYWQTKTDIKMGPAVHYGYAFQWFALTATLLVLSIVSLIKRSEKVSRHNG